MPNNEPFVPWMRSLLERMKELYGKANAKTIAEALPDGNFFKIKGSVSTTSALPVSGNDVGDIYIVSEDGSEHIWVTSESHPNGYWEKLGVDIVVDAAAVALAIHAMTAAQKAGVLLDIGAASSIGAVTINDVYDAIYEEPLLRYDTAQLSITDAQKAQVRTNIGAEAKISDLAAIRSGAQAGATAVQPDAIFNMATQAWVGQQGYLTQHQDISGKLNVNQGVANAGKFIVVGSDGNITAVTMQTWQGGSY